MLVIDVKRFYVFYYRYVFTFLTFFFKFLNDFYYKNVSIQEALVLQGDRATHLSV